MAEARSKDAEADEESGPREHRSATAESERAGTLASDEALAALREKLSGGQS